MSRAKIIQSKKAITPFAKMMEKEGIAVEETVFMGSVDEFCDALLWNGKKERELQELLRDYRCQEIFKYVED